MALFVVLAVLLAACRQEPLPPQGENAPGDTHPITLQAVFGDVQDTGTKVAIANANGVNFAWSAGDQIAVHSTDGSYHVLTLLAGAGEASATFEGEFSGNQNFYAVYPASIKDEVEYGNGTLKVSMPSSYTISGSMGTSSPLPMIAVNDAGTLSFKHVGGVYRLVLDDVPAGTTSIAVTFDRGVTGNFTVNDPGTAAPYIATADGAGQTVTFNLSSPLAVETDGFVLNVPVPSGYYPTNTVIAYGGDHAVANTFTDSGMVERAMGRKTKVTLLASSNGFSRSGGYGGPFTYNSVQYQLSQGCMHTGGNLWYDYSLYDSPFDGLEKYNKGDATTPKSGYDRSEDGQIYFTWLFLVELFDDRTEGDRPSLANDKDINNSKSPVYSDGILPTTEQWAAFANGNSSRPGSTVYYPGGVQYNAHAMPVIVDLTGSEYAGKGLGSIMTSLYAQANTQAGWLLFPDGAHIAVNIGFGRFNSNADPTTISYSDFTLLSSLGCVLLPTAGFYTYTSNPATEVNVWEHGGSEGYYWSASASNYNDANYFYTTTNYCLSSVFSHNKGKHCHPVRLIK